MTLGLQAHPTPVVSVGAVVVDRAGRVLLVRRSRPPMAGAWTLPGGRVESGESLETAVVREVREETAVATQVVCALGVVDISREGFAYAIYEHLLVPLKQGVAPVPADDAADARWARRTDISILGVRADAIGVIDQALAEASRRGLVDPDP